MADIKKELNDIKNAVYGKEVRGSIHDGIKKINDEVENATDLSESAKHQVENIQKQVNHLVVEGDSSVEAAQARVDAEGKSFPTLKARLDEKETQFSSQLAQTQNELGDKTTLPAWLQDSLREVAAMHDGYLRDIAINVKSPPYLIKGDGVTDETSAIQDMINDLPENTVFNFPPGEYVIDPDISLRFKNNTKIILNGSFKAKPTDTGSNRIIRLYDSENVEFYGGEIIGDRYSHLGDDGEWGNGVDIRGSKNIKFINTTVRDCWGDGFYIGRSFTTDKQCEDIFLINCVSDNNRRQGLSIVHANGVIVWGGKYSNSNGTAPESGIDLETNPGDSVENVKLLNVEISGNAGAGFISTTASNVKLIGCVSHNNGGDGYHIRRAIEGISYFTIDDCTAHSNGGDGFYHYHARNSFYNNVKSFNNGGWGLNFLDGIRNNNITNVTSYGNVLGGFIMMADGTQEKVSYGNNIDNLIVYDNERGIHIVGATLTRNNLTNFQSYNNARTGITISRSSYNNIINFIVRDNGREGFLMADANDNTVTGSSYNNSQSQDNRYDNIYILNSKRNNIQGCKARVMGDIQARYGISIEGEESIENLVANNDLFQGGRTGDFNDEGTRTRTLGGNRLTV